ncbi:MAG TPA: GerW family sporulation protein [Chitinophagaceae bacterium]|nr:GerW family sporulation protein [Chitinophagaceae bacterium]
MSTNFEETVKQLTDFLKTEAKTETVIGQQFQLGEFTCVPVIKFGIGLGYGGGEGSGEMPNKGKGEGGGSGAGAGMGVMPIGFLVTRAGEISFIHTSTSKGLGAAFEKVPDLLEKFMNRKNANKQEPVTA